MKDLDQRLVLLASHAVGLHKDLTREQKNGVNDEWLKEDIAKAETYVHSNPIRRYVNVTHEL